MRKLNLLNKTINSLALNLNFTNTKVTLIDELISIPEGGCSAAATKIHKKESCGTLKTNKYIVT